MPFAQLPSSPGFQAPQAPSWAPFAMQAVQNIQHGGDIQAQAGKDFADSIEKSAAQISAILQYQSPQEKTKRQLQQLQLETLTGVYNDYKAHPEKYQMTANGPVLIDPLARMEKITKIGRDVAYINSLHTQSQLPDNVKSAIDSIAAIKSGRARVVPAGDQPAATEPVPGSGTDYGSALLGGATAPPSTDYGDENFNATTTN